MKIFTDPKLFNYILMCLYVASAIRWGIARKPMDMLYWIGAFIITCAVTFKK